MNFPFTPSDYSFLHPLGYAATLRRLMGNLRGFAYRRRLDAHWTMDFVSGGCRDVTGYDAHRFMPKPSIAFAELIMPADQRRANEQIRLAVLHRHRVMVDYRLQAAHGALVPVEDRLTPVFDSAGKLLAIEGVVCPARSLESTGSRQANDCHQSGKTVDGVGAVLASDQPVTT